MPNVNYFIILGFLRYFKGSKNVKKIIKKKYLMEIKSAAIQIFFILIISFVIRRSIC